MYVSADRGATWAPLNSGLANVCIEIQVNPRDGAQLYVNEVSERPSSTQVTEKLYRSSDGGVNWQQLPASWSAVSLEIDPASGAMYRAGITALYRSLDGGPTWTTFGLPSDLEGIRRIYVHPRNGSLYGLGKEYLHTSTDGGQSWEQQELSIRDDLREYGTLYFHLLGEIGYLAYRTWMGQLTSDLDQYVECDSLGHDVTDVAIDPTDSQRVYVATRGGGVQGSVNGCQSWRSRNRGLDNHYVNAVAIDPTNPDLLYAATDGGAYVSYDRGERWGTINDGLLGATVVYDIEIDPNSPGNVYAATPYGIFLLEKR